MSSPSPTSTASAPVGAGRWPLLLSPTRAGGWELRNRIVSTPYATGWGTGGPPSDAEVTYHLRKAEGGAALVTTLGSASVNPDTSASYGSVSLWDPRNDASFAALADGVHAHGALVVSQMMHIDRRGTSISSGIPLRGDSDPPEGAHREVPVVLSPPELARIAERFAASARARLPVIAAGRILDADAAEKALREDGVILAAMTRAIIADPDLPVQLLDGRAPRSCTSMNEGCIGRLYSALSMACSINPAIHEPALDAQDDVKVCQRAHAQGRRSRVVVVGGGPAGAEVAGRAARRGAAVVLSESRQTAGGRARTAGLRRGRERWGLRSDWSVHEMAQAGVDAADPRPDGAVRCANRPELPGGRPAACSARRGPRARRR